MNWFQLNGYKENPLCIKPKAELHCRKNEFNEILRNVFSGNVVEINGENGAGKTSILKALEKELKKQGGFTVTFRGVLDKSHLKKMEKRGLLERIKPKLGFKPKKQVLLLDDSQSLLHKEQLALKNLYDNDALYSIVFASTETRCQGMPCFEMAAKKTKLGKLSQRELKEILEKRAGKKKLFEEKAVNYLARISEGNPKKFLRNCQRAYMECSGSNKSRVVTLNELKRGGFKKVNETKRGKTSNPLNNLTPLQKDILFNLKRSPMSLSELSKATGSSIGTIGKQLSIMGLKTNKTTMARKGVFESLIKKDKSNIITIYSLSEAGNELLSGR